MTVDAIQTVSLELLRPGPSHGQLLSPLTPYIALCGDEGPVTLNIDVEHWKLLNSLARLRYTAQGRGGRPVVSIPEGIRQSEVLELGDEMGRILKDIPTLASEMGRAAGRLYGKLDAEGGLVHLRLITSGSELSLLPFEMMISPKGYPGDGIGMLLQPRLPMVMTREVRRGRPRTIDWNRQPKILFVSASPQGMYVPQRAHLLAIRKALDPWIWWGDEIHGRKPQQNVSRHLHVLTNASIEDIEQACRDADYTHVHVLAHGDSYEEAGQLRYGLALHDHGDRGEKRVVNGTRIAEALLAGRRCQNRRSHPLFVSLATCDSGNVSSVAVPGGSIAHDLHAHGIPWVLASQFPLTMDGSVRMAEILFSGLLHGEDPRRLLRRLRSSLHVAGKNDHDWASIVAYASVPESLGEQAVEFKNRQMRKAIDTELDRAHKARAAEKWEDLEDAIKQTRAWLRRWEASLPTGDDTFDRDMRAEYHGVAGATDKRAAEIYMRDETDQDQDQKYKRERSNKLLESARKSYMRAMGTGLAKLQHWPATQYLSLTAVLKKSPDRDRWYATIAFASEEINQDDPGKVAWGHGTLAELEMLKPYHVEKGDNGTEVVKRKVVDHCRKIVDLMGSDSFHVFSTKRQFERYMKLWPEDQWNEIASAAVDALPCTYKDG